MERENILTLTVAFMRETFKMGSGQGLACSITVKMSELRVFGKMVS
jgi:hypothetical protein